MKRLTFILIILMVMSTTNLNAVNSESHKDISTIKSKLLYAYTITPYDYKNCDVIFITTHTLIIDTQKYKGQCYYINSEVDSEAAKKFKPGDKVDVFGLFYVLNSHTGEYIYGGITPSQKNKVSKKLLGTLFVSGEPQKSLNNEITLEKDLITIQEFDFKIRNYLMKKYNLYSTTSPYKGGRIEIGMKDGKHEKIDLFFFPNKGTREDILKKYKDNKTLDMKLFSHFDVYLEK
ncbi:TPA: exotoxin [Streptococcus equi subsp. equi]|nr:exotoxin [Streptococcus equi subsp. equi]